MAGEGEREEMLGCLSDLVPLFNRDKFLIHCREAKEHLCDRGDTDMVRK